MGGVGRLAEINVPRTKNLILQTTGPLAVALSTLCATSAFAATQVSYKVDLVDSQVPPALKDILEVDKLGFDCIRADKLDLAFDATGSGVRVPRTCLPEPCTKALLPEELAILVGRSPTDDEWEDYFSRYADFCRKEIPPTPVLDGFADLGVDSDKLNDFWTPLLSTFAANSPATGPRLTARPSPVSVFGGPTGGGSSGGITGGLTGGGTGGATGGGTGGGTNTTLFTPPGNPPTVSILLSSGPVVPVPVPLPAAFWALLVGLGGLVSLRLQRTRRTN